MKKKEELVILKIPRDVYEANLSDDLNKDSNGWSKVISETKEQSAKTEETMIEETLVKKIQERLKKQVDKQIEIYLGL